VDTSFKAVVFDSAHRVLLGMNPRREWELLGGRADPRDRGPADTIRRELREEAGIEVVVGDLIDIWYLDIPSGGRVAVASYQAWSAEPESITSSDEHTQLAFFELDRLDRLNLPDGYATTIRLASERVLRKGTPPS
jgi:8-oxo-dGTP pyrophosphatase MutT (NUDIX family)